MNKFYSFFSLALTVCVLALTAGCGGVSRSGGSPGAASSPVAKAKGKVRLTIKWPSVPATPHGIMPRLVPEAAQSVRVVLKTADGTIIAQQVVARPAGQSTSTATFSNILAVSITVTATAYPNADGTGTVLATGSIGVTVLSGDTTTASVTMGSTIDHLAITPAAPSVAVGATTPLSATAFDATGAMVLTTASKLTWVSSAPTLATVDAAGVVTGVAAGTSTITVTDTESTKSATTTVTITASTGTGGGAGTIQIVNSPTLYPTIQAAVNAAKDGDTVKVGDGTYSGDGNRDIDFGGKSITVTSQDGPAKTIIDCGGYASTDGSGNHRGFYIHTSETNAVISGFTVMNGYEYAYDGIEHIGGGGILIFNSSPLIQNCVIMDNSAYEGGGVCKYNFQYNKDTITLADCIIENNFGGFGGGVYNINDGGGKIALTSCTFTSNTASVGYGYAGGQGGGVFNDNGNGNNTITLTNCTFVGNTASNAAGYAGGNGGGGVYNSNYSYGSNDVIALTNCSFNRNTAGNNSISGGGICNEEGSGIITLTNEILYGDIGGEIGRNHYLTSNAVASYCDIQGGYAGTSNIDTDPLFANASAGDLHLMPGSPCLGAGTPNGAPATDKDGKSRPNPPSMGAYE